MGNHAIQLTVIYVLTRYSTDVIASKTLKGVRKKWNVSLLQSAQEKLASSNMWYFPMLEELASSESAEATAGCVEEDSNEGGADEMKIRTRSTLALAVEKLADLLGPIETRKALVSVSGPCLPEGQHLPQFRFSSLGYKTCT